MDTGITQNCSIYGNPTQPALELDNPLCTKCTNHVSQLRAPLVSPFEHLLSDTVRHLPSRSEVLEIRGIIRDADQRIAEIEATSQRIRLVLDHLAQERRTIEDFANKHRVMVAPVWSLPPEILSHIFFLCLPVRMDWAEIKRSSLKNSIILAQVNRHWRSVALSTPKIWTTIHIDENSFPKTYNDNDQEEISMPKVFLQRSGVCSLSLRVYTSEYNEAILAILLPLAERWHRITLDIPLPMLSALSPISNRLLLLRTLEIKAAALGRRHLTFFSNSPLLRHLITSCWFLDAFDILPLHQLTRWDTPTAAADMPKIFALAPSISIVR